MSRLHYIESSTSFTQPGFALFCILYINFTTENTSDILKTKNQNKEARFTCVVKIMATPFALKKANIWSCGHFECNRVREKKLFCTNFDLCIRN